MSIYHVRLTKRARKGLRKIPRWIAGQFKVWLEAVETDGIREVRKIKSYHDEPLQGDRFGQRSFRLNISYRAIYVEKKDGMIELIEVQEINKHDY